jgi:hypothetical protein
MRNASLVQRPSRILQDIGDGWLEEDELDAVATWLAASPPVSVPDDLIELALKTPARAQARVA